MAATIAAPGAPMAIDVFRPGAGPTSTPARVITGFTYPIPLAVGNNAELIVLHDGRIDTFGGAANGAATPARSIPVASGTVGGPSAIEPASDSSTSRGAR